MAKATQSLSAALNKGEPLPQELPLLISDKISMDSLRASAEQMRQEIANATGAPASASFVSDLRDWTDMGVTRVGLFMSYYNLATQVQARCLCGAGLWG